MSPQGSASCIPPLAQTRPTRPCLEKSNSGWHRGTAIGLFQSRNPVLIVAVRRGQKARMRLISLAIALFVFWLALSGHYTPMLVVIGGISAAACALAAARIRIVDAEGHPIEWLSAWITYFPWLIGEIAKSAWAVARIVLTPGLPISPALTVVKASQRSSVGIAAFANSITLTPGTITVAVNGNDLIVHSLVREGAVDLAGGEMDRRVRALEGRA
jgi:multicomponent Na+:H+ antiporter subunit E